MWTKEWLKIGCGTDLECRWTSGDCTCAGASAGCFHEPRVMGEKFTSNPGVCVEVGENLKKKKS
jgi:hypothetical protein